MRYTIALAIACALLAACGGGGGASDTCTPPTIQLFGDSTQVLAAPYWMERWGPRVTSNAVGGTTSRQLLAGTDGLNKPWPQSVTSDVVVIKHGTNDATLYYVRTPIEQYKDNLRAFARNTSAFVVFETPDPATTAERSVSVPPYAQAMREVAAELHAPLIDTDACWRKHEGWQGFLYDGTHATAEGSQYTVNVCAAPVVEALSCRESLRGAK